jgi:hypothetical protein
MPALILPVGLALLMHEPAVFSSSVDRPRQTDYPQNQQLS